MGILRMRSIHASISEESSGLSFSSIKLICINDDVSLRLSSAAHIRTETLRGNRGLGSGCYGTLENVSKGAELVVLL